MTIPVLVHGAMDRAETFHYHVDPAAGNDTTGAGTKAAPYATLGKGLTVASTGQSVGLKRGTTHRAGSTVASTLANIRVGAYGTGAKPIVSGGTVVTGWTRQLAAPTTGTPLAVNDSFTGTTGTALTAHTGETGATWAKKSGDSGDGRITSSGRVGNNTSGTKSTLAAAGTPASAEYIVEADLYVASVISGAAVNLAARLDNSGNYYLARYNGTHWVLFSSVAFSGGINVVGSAQTLTPGNTYHMKFVCSNAAKTLYVDGVQVATSSDNTITAANNAGLEFTANAGSDSTGYQIDNFTVGPIVAGAGTNIYTASLTTAPGIVAAAGTALTLGASASALTSGQYFWASNVLTVNLGGTDPGTVTIEAGTVTKVMSFVTSGQRVVLRNLDVRFGQDQCVFLSGLSSFIVDSCNIQWANYVSNFGSLYAQLSTYGQIVRNTIAQVMNDGIVTHGTSNLEVAHNSITGIGFLPGDIQSDGFQMGDSGFGSGLVSTGVWIHHNVVDLSGSSSPKGCIIIDADPSISTTGIIIEYNTCTGGNYGVAAHANNTTVRHNTCLNQVSSFGGGVHVDSGYVLDNIQIYRNLIAGSNREGIVVQPGANNRTNFVIANNTIINAGRVSIDIEAPISGIIKNNILWWTVQPSFANMVINAGVVSGETLVCDYNDLGPAFTNYLRTGSLYSTLAAWQSATGYDAHSIAGDPLVSAPLYVPAVGSPAIDAGVVVSGITDGYLGAAPDMGYVEAA